MTMTLVSTITVGAGGAASLEWTGIPQTGTDLLVVVSPRKSSAQTEGDFRLRFNGSSSGYADKALQGNGSSAASTTYATTAVYAYQPGANATANTFGNLSFYIPNYTSSVAKSISGDWVTENNATTAYQVIAAYSWSGTASIASIVLTDGFVQYSSASLYLVTKGSGGASVS